MRAAAETGIQRNACLVHCADRLSAQLVSHMSSLTGTRCKNDVKDMQMGRRRKEETSDRRGSSGGQAEQRHQRKERTASEEGRRCNLSWNLEADTRDAAGTAHEKKREVGEASGTKKRTRLASNCNAVAIRRRFCARVASSVPFLKAE